MAERDEFGIVFNNKYQAWYIVFRTKDTLEFKIDTKYSLIKDQHGNDSITDEFLERIKYIAAMGYTFNPYINKSTIDSIDWF